MAYQLAPVWPEPAEGIRHEIVRFWSDTGALTDAATARERSRQLVVVARDAHGEVACVSTAVRVPVPQLGFDCFYYRTFIAPSARNRGLRSTQLVWQILQQSYRVLNGRFLDGSDPEVLGLYVLQELSVTLIVTTYQAGKLVLERPDNGVINTHFRAFNQPMGLAIGNERIAIGTEQEIIEFHNVPDAAGKLVALSPHSAQFGRSGGLDVGSTDAP